jgi:SAM-dependent methyltransferase
MESDAGVAINAVSARRRAEWCERVEAYAREAVPKNRPFAVALVERVAPPVGARVLDVATGPGVVAVEAAKQVGPEGTVLATDFLAEWEPHVTANAAAAALGNITFVTMPAEVLDLPAASFDAVFCQFGLMFMPDPLAALREMRRVLHRDGRLGVTVWSVPENVGIFTVPRVIAAALPSSGPDAPPSPMGMGEPGLLEGLVAKAGFREVTVERVTRSFALADAEAEWRQWSENTSSPAAQGLARLSPRERQRLHDAAIAALEAFRDGDVLRVASEAIVVTATR